MMRGILVEARNLEENEEDQQNLQNVKNSLIIVETKTSDCPNHGFKEKKKRIMHDKTKLDT